METTVFHSANILDCTGNDPYPGTVVVVGDRIQAVGPQTRYPHHEMPCPLTWAA